MCEADRDEELVAIFGRQFGPDPIAIGGGSGTQVDRDVEDTPTDAPDQFVLPARGRLEVKAAESEGGRGEGVVILNESAIDAPRGERGRRVDLGEPATSIAKTLRLNQLNGVVGHQNSLPISIWLDNLNSQLSTKASPSTMRRHNFVPRHVINHRSDTPCRDHRAP